MENSNNPEAAEPVQTTNDQAVDLSRFVRCSSCVHWQEDENRYNNAISPDYNPVTLDEWSSEEERLAWFPYEVRYCKHPKVLFYQRPEKDGAAVFDGSDYMAYLATGPNYGCVNGESESSPNT